jgi:hypothetical protein
MALCDELALSLQTTDLSSWRRASPEETSPVLLSVRQPEWWQW